MTKRAAVTGGTGFVGTALFELLLHEGWSVTALARDPAKLAAFPDISVIPGDLNDDAALNALAQNADVFFHLAGVTHARTASDYHTVNVAGAERAAAAARDAGTRFVHASSMSARMPDVSPYARSKFDSEAAIAAAFAITGNDNWIALRLPAIYGPRDMVTLPFFKLVKKGLALEPKTASPARASILHVDDAAGALFAAAQPGIAPGVYEVGDERPDGHPWNEIGATLGQALERPIRPVRVPRLVIAAYHSLLRTVEGAMGRNPSVREGQINEFFHEDWVARDNLLSDACGWKPKTPLQEGFAKTARWYQEHDLL